MNEIKIYPYKMGSRSAKFLADSFGAMRVYPNRKYKAKPNHLIINWGSTKIPKWHDSNNNILNLYSNVSNAVEKIKALRLMADAGVDVIDFTTDKHAAELLLENNTPVVERHITNGTQGAGIKIKRPGDTIEDAPLYTLFIEKAREYRIHVFKGEVIDTQQKKRRSGTGQEISGDIKNHANGWVYCREGITEPPANIYEQAKLAVKSLGFDFGAVDILTKDGRVYVLEVNTSPNLEGTTLLNYINAIKKCQIDQV